MEQTAKILEMKSLGFTQEQIAKHLGIDRDEVGEAIKQKSRPPIKRTSLPPPPPQATPCPAPAQRPIQEIKPGLYLLTLTAEDLLEFMYQLQRQNLPPADPYEDYVPKEEFQEKFCISDTSLQRHQKAGTLRVYRLGNKCYLKKSEIIRALERGSL